jgi:hypothetical protein
VFWERLTVNEQNRYWEISQRMKKYIAACLAYPNAVKTHNEWFHATSIEKRDDILRREERKINHFIRNPLNHVVLNDRDYAKKIALFVGNLQIEMHINQCTDAELIEADRLASKGWGQ